MATATQQQKDVVAEQAAVAESMRPAEQQRVVYDNPRSYSDVATTDGPTQKQKNTLRGLGIAECVIGGLSVLLAVASNSVVLTSEAKNRRTSLYGYGSNGIDTTTSISAGIWSGVFTIVTGVLGIRLINTPSRCMHIANLTMAIITAVINTCGTMVSMVAILFSSTSSSSSQSGVQTSMIALHSTTTLLCFASMLLTMVHSSFSNKRSCYKRNSVSTRQITVYPQQITVQPQLQYVQCPNGQLMMIVNQPMMPQTITQVPNFQEITPTVPFLATNMPYASSRLLEGAYGVVYEEAPPAYFPGV